jgi:hypothetical protein
MVSSEKSGLMNGNASESVHNIAESLSQQGKNINEKIHMNSSEQKASEEPDLDRCLHGELVQSQLL